MPHPHLSIGCDIGGTHISCAAVDMKDGEMVKGTRSRVSYGHEAESKLILSAWAQALNETIEKTGSAQWAGIGFAMPGPFDYRNGVSKMRHKFPSLYDICVPAALKPLLARGRDLPMRFLNDATAFAVGEAWRGEGRGYQKVVVVTLGTGFGSAFLEAGVPVVARADVPKEGCLWHLAFKNSIADDYFSTKWFTRAYAAQGGETVEGVKALIEKAAHDDFVRGLFTQFGQNLAECLAPWLRLFAAELLIIGGNIAHALPLFGASLREDLQKAGVTAQVAPSRLWEDAALIGSARLLDDDFWKQVSATLPNL